MAATSWSIHDDGSVWAIVNDDVPPVLLDAPELSDLPAGDYTYEQIVEALEAQETAK